MKPHPEQAFSSEKDGPRGELAGFSALEVVESLEEAFLAVDEALRIQAVNTPAEKLLGMPRSALVGASLDSILDGQALSPAVLEGCQRAFLEPEPLRLIGHRASVDQWLEIRLRPQRGQVWLFLRDVTQEHKTEERLRDFEQQQSVLRYVIAHVPHAIFWKDRQGRLLGGNQNFMKDVGVDSLEVLVGKTDYELCCTAEEAHAISRIDNQVMESGTPILNLEEPVHLASGEQRTLLTSKVPLRDDRGDVVGMVGIYADITERKRMEVELQKAKEVAETAARTKDEFLTVMSHELRTPLTLILGPLGMLLSVRSSELSERARVDLERIHRNAERLFRLVDDILDHQKVEAGQMKVNWEPTEVTPLTAAIIEDARSAAASRDIEVRFEAEANLGASPLDRRKFEKIVLNLLGNALKFTPEGGSISVALRALGPRLELSVKDTGPGIPSSKQGLLFQRFQQIDSSATRKYEGTGMGLAIVKEFAELMGGQVAVESELGVGSRFIVSLPRNADQLVPRSLEIMPPARTSHGYRAHLTPAPIPIHPAPRRTVGSVPRLLIAEDNADMRAYLANLLAEGYDIELAENGRQAWEAVQRQRPHVIISDVMMPEMDGTELVSRLKASEQFRDIPVLMLTAKASREEVVGGLEAGADDYLGKPFGPAELKARVRAAVRLHDFYLQLHKRTGELETALRQLRETQEQLVIKAKMAAVGTLVSGLCHELNNPMAAIRMSMEMISRYPLDGEARRQALDVIDRQSRRCASLLKALIEFSSRPAVIHLSCEVQSVVERVIELARPELSRRGLRLEQRLSGAEPPWVHVHAVEMENALLCVVRNALEASSPEATVTIEARALAREGNPGVEVTVRDTGPGIPDELLSRVVEPFFTTKPPGEGIGLGLSLAHRFIESHGGSLNIESQVGHGTAVRMWLPAAPVSQPSHVLGTEVRVL
ncbi:ATP-binding protein [Hyalangium versicolor]|uniref:ATP-binding protein n=1 Tax=Hyalangium versicolor TaxID=2861190 RepID=UPI001CC94E19|nr:ATP-binding protein [Hyalangium versicolor]